MDIKTGLVIAGEMIFTGALIYLMTKEEKVVAFENRAIVRIKAASNKRRRTRELKRQIRINRKALYVPLEADGIKAGTKAA